MHMLRVDPFGCTLLLTLNIRNTLTICRTESYDTLRFGLKCLSQIYVLCLLLESLLALTGIPCCGTGDRQHHLRCMHAPTPSSLMLPLEVIFSME